MNLEQLRTALQARGFGSDTVTEQTEALNAVYRHINGLKRWPFLEDDAQVTATPGEPVVDLSSVSDVLSIDALRAEFGTEYYDLEFMERRVLRQQSHLDRERGVPQYWTRHGSQLVVYPRPDRAYTLTLDYIMDPPALSDDGDVPVWPETYHDILVIGAAIQFAHRERDWSAHAALSGEYADRRFAMDRELGVRQRQNATHVRRSDFWDSFDRVL